MENILHVFKQKLLIDISVFDVIHADLYSILTQIVCQSVFAEGLGFVFLSRGRTVANRGDQTARNC